MSLSKKTQRNLKVFNHLKYNTGKVVYNIKRIVLDTSIDTFVTAFKEVQADVSIDSEVR